MVSLITGTSKKNISEHVIVDYYKKGKQIYQYSNDYLKLLENEGSNGFEYNPIQTLDIESSYKEGKIYSGFAYIDNENSFTTKEIEKGKTKKIDIDVFAMHYFNRVTIKEVDDVLEITTLDDENSKILIEKVMDTLTCKLVDKKVIAYKVNKVFNFQDLPKNSMIRSSIFQNEPLTIVMRIDKELENQSSCQELFRNISLFNFKDLDDFYTKFELANNEQNNFEKVALLIAYVMTDENSAIKNGIYWEPTNGGQYHEYLKGSELKIESQTLEEFQKSIDIFF
ncbi:hypothetical protein ACU8V7_27150 [Zobellia nedashkovskayae]